MTKPTIYLHVGATKTGTTALQRFCEENFSQLIDKHGVLYPNFHDKHIYSMMQPGRNYWQGYHFENFDSSSDLELFNRCIDYCNKRSLNSILISHEALLINWPDRIGLLANRIDANIKIICYVRRQDHYLESVWKQVGYKFISPNDILRQKDNEGWGGWRFYDWYQLITPWANYFGKDNIIVRPYEKEQMPDGLFSDFLKVINVVWDGKPELANKNAKVNTGFSRDVMEFMYLNKDFCKDLNDQRLYNMLHVLLNDNFTKGPFQDYGILSPADRLALLEEYEPSNQRLAREYLARPDGRLFVENWPLRDEPWEPYEGLTVERVVPIFTTMIYELHVRQLRTQEANQDLIRLLQIISRVLAPLRRIYRRIKRVA